MSKNIAIISYHTDPFSSLGGDTSGGMNVYVRELTKSFSKLGFKIDIFTRSHNPRLEKKQFPSKNSRIIRILAGPQNDVKKNKLIDYLNLFTKQIFLFSKEEKNSYDLVISHYWLSGVIGKKLCEKWRIPLILRFHTLGKQKEDVLHSYAFSENKNRIETEKKLSKFCDAIIVSSNNEKKTIIEDFAISPRKIHIIPCGVNPYFFQQKKTARKKLGLKNDIKYFLSVGRIDPVKGLDLYMHSLKFLKLINPELKFHALHIGGIVKKNNKKNNFKGLNGKDFQSTSQTKEVERILSLSKKLNVYDNFSFIGSRTHYELSYWYSAVELLAIPSRYETFCLVALEAASCGLPAVAYKVGGIAESIKQNFTGILVPEGSTSEYALTLNNLLINKKFSEKLGENAKDRAQIFSWENTAKAEIKIWRTLKV
tara:strand:+ start:17081 stop:18355 length:1275 start_codon:yes stop_codon:yes gene_type:complete